MLTRGWMVLAKAAAHGLILSNVAIAATVTKTTATKTTATKSLSQMTEERRLITGTVTAVTELALTLAGPGVNIINASILYGDPDQFGLFAGGSDSIGIDSGVIISTGGIHDIKGPNKRATTTSQYGGPGYAPLNELTGGIPTKDAAVLQIDFACDSGQIEEFHLQYVWASEEYNEYVNDLYADLAAFFLNGLDASNNVATVSINSINCGNPYYAPSINNTKRHCDLFVNNDLNFRTTEYNIEYDGFTVPLQVDSTSRAGTNTIIIAIADKFDDKIDSALMLGEGSLLCGPLGVTKTPTTTPPAQPPTRYPTTQTAAPSTQPPTRYPTTPTATPPQKTVEPSNTSTPSKVTVEPSNTPTSTPTSIPTTPPTRKPVAPLCRRASQSCSNVATSSLKCCKGNTCRAKPSGTLRCVSCLAPGKTCGTTTLPCCDGFKCSSTAKRCVACKPKASTCTSTTQCCGSLRCNTSTKTCA